MNQNLENKIKLDVSCPEGLLGFLGSYSVRVIVSFPLGQVYNQVLKKVYHRSKLSANRKMVMRK